MVTDKSKKFKILLLLASLLGAAEVSANEQSGDVDESSLDELLAMDMADLLLVKVTSQKREQDLREVPLAVTVVDRPYFDDGLINNLQSLYFFAPTMNFRKGNSTYASNLFLRGVGTAAFSVGSEPSVGAVVDGVPLSASGNAFAYLHDIKRVEVLSGPQGTLFGKNASSGIVNIITEDPTQDRLSYVAFSAADGHEYKADFIVSGALTETVSARTSIAYYDFGGNVYNSVSNSHTNGAEYLGIRSKLQWRLSGSSELKISADYAETDSECCAQLIGELNVVDEETARIDQILRGYGIEFAGEATRQTAQDFAPDDDQLEWGLSATLNSSLYGHSATAIAAVRKWTVDQAQDQNSLPTNTYVGFSSINNRGHTDYEQQSMEVHLNSDSGGKFEYILGGLLWHSKQNRRFSRETFTCDIGLAGSNTIGDPCDTTVDQFIDDAYSISQGAHEATVNFKNYALFGNTTYELSSDIDLIAGARYSYDRVDFRFLRQSPAPGLGVRPGFTDSGAVSNRDFSGKLGIQAYFSGDLTIYGTATQGYKGPGFNTFFNMVEGLEGPLKPETSLSIEVGLKANVWNSRINMAVWHADYKNYQSNSFVEVGNSGFSTVSLTNAGKINSRGVEMNVYSKLLQSVDIFGGIAFTDASIDSFKIDPRTGEPSAPNGSRLPYAPELKGFVGAEYSITNLEPANLKFRLTGSYSDEQYSSLGESAISRMSSFSLLNASVKISSKDACYALTISVNNLLDDRFVVAAGSSGASSLRQYLSTREGERFFGIQVQMQF